MIDAGAIVSALQARGYSFFSGVPCSYLTPLINGVIGADGLTYCGATSEGEAVAMAAGAWLAGRKAVIMCQNSGLGNMVNPLTSLNAVMRIPCLLVVTWRGEPGGKPDEPQHELMGQVTRPLLDLLGIPNELFPETGDVIQSALDRAESCLDTTSTPYALVLRSGAVAPVELRQPAAEHRPRGAIADARLFGRTPRRSDYLESLVMVSQGKAAVVATTGKTGRELFTLDDRASHFYNVGAMGSASAIGLGVALNSNRPVVVVDGDGAALMRMGTFATIGNAYPPRLIHVVIDNGVHDSTGGQQTASASVSFADTALACGYATAAMVDSVTGFRDAFSTAMTTPGPHCIHALASPGSISPLGRPTLGPPAAAQRFRDWLATSGG